MHLCAEFSLADFKPQHAEKKAKTLPIVLGVVGSFIVLLVLGILCWRYYLKPKSERGKGLGCLSSIRVNTSEIFMVETFENFFSTQSQTLFLLQMISKD